MHIKKNEVRTPNLHFKLNSLNLVTSFHCKHMVVTMLGMYPLTIFATLRRGPYLNILREFASTYDKLCMIVDINIMHN